MTFPQLHLDIASVASSLKPTMISPSSTEIQSNRTESAGLGDEGFHSGGEDEDTRNMLCTSVSEPSTTVVNAPFHYITSLPSKGVREKLIIGLNVWIATPPEALEIVTSVVADVHSLSLMLDDVQDNSALRRSQPSTHSIFGAAQTINAATYRIVEVLRRSSGVQNPVFLGTVIDVKQVLTIMEQLEEMQRLMVGQSLDLFWTNHVSVPSIKEYLQMVDGKTGGLFRMASKLMITQSESAVVMPADLDKLMMLLGRYFQIRDDYFNLTSHEYTKSKGFCEDLDEGKYSFILIHALKSADYKTRILLENMLLQRRAAGAASDGHKALILSVLKKTGSFQYTLDMLCVIYDEILDAIDTMERKTGVINNTIRDLVTALRINADRTC